MESLIIWLFHFLFFFFHYQSAFSSPLFSFPSANNSCSHEERSSLLQFKQMFTINSSEAFRPSLWCEDNGYPSYAKTLSWNETTDCCSWDGVTCDASTGHVTGLNLSCSKLYGTIHPNTTLFQLSHLQQLNLAFNHFNFSHISPSFSHFTSLSHLNLSNSFLSGSIPSEIAHLSRLVSLDLSSDYDVGLRLEPHNFKTLLMNLTQLENLMLHQVNISSGLPDSLLNLSSLATIDLGETGLLGDLPHQIFQLPKLQNLDLGYNYHMTGNLLKVKWGCNSSLEKLVLAGNQFDGPLPESLGNLTRVTTLHLSGNGFTGHSPNQGNNRNGEIPDFFAKLLKLELLGLGTNNFGAVPFPLWVSNLTQLIGLDISNTALMGPIPSNITGFRKLQELFLSNSSLNGTLPSWLFAIPSLQQLDLSSNQLTGQIHEFQRDSPLEYIDLSYNKLSGPIPQSISSLVNLSDLYLQSNNLSGDVELQKFSNLPSLQRLNLSSNQLTGQIHEFQRDSPLVWIDLSYNKLSGPIPHSISGLVNLSELYLQSNNLSGDVELQKFSNLQVLHLSKNNLSVRIGSNANATWPNLWSLGLSSCNITEFPDFLQNSVENCLGLLDLSSNKIHGEIPKWVLERTCVYFLDLSHNKLTGEIPSSICNLSSLNTLVLSNNNFTGVIPQCLGNVSYDLSVLDLRMNGFCGEIPTTFANGSTLRSLNLYGNHLQGPVPRSLANCRSLEVLDLGNNNLSGEFPHWLESLPDLQVLVLKSNGFHGPIGTLGTNTPFPKLRIFDLSRNNFSGLLPEGYFLKFKAMMNLDKSKMLVQYMENKVSQGMIYRDSVELVQKGHVVELEHILTIFTTIDFSCNNFRGEIPNDIGKLQGLRLLNLSQNSLSGHLQPLLGNITMLESLDLSSNQLTGKIPGELTSLTFLAVLNLSKNHFVGPIPNGKQFDTFENNSYIGNSGLCGLPLSKKCGDSEAQAQPISQDEDDDDFASGFTWRIVLMGYGCGFVIGVTMGFVMFLIGRPRWFTRIVREEPRRKVVRVRQIGWRRGHQS